MTETQALIKLETLTALEVFRDPASLDAIIEGIEREVRAATLDASTPVGREQIRSLAFKVTRSKTAIVKMGLDLTEGWREKTKLVNSERKRAEERLAALADEARRPLTEFENREKSRIAAHETALSSMQGAATVGSSIERMEAFKASIQEFFTGRDWQEFQGRARQIRDEAFESLDNRIESQKMADAQAAELAELRRKEAERQEQERVRLQAEHEARLRLDAAESARLEAERKAKVAADAEAARVIAAANLGAERVARETQRLEREKQEAEAAAERAEAKRVASEKKAAQALLDAQVKADREREAAVQAERDRYAEDKRIADQKVQAEAAAIIKREADKKHRAKIEQEAIDSLAFPGELHLRARCLAVEVIRQIAEGKVRNVKVIY